MSEHLPKPPNGAAPGSPSPPNAPARGYDGPPKNPTPGASKGRPSKDKKWRRIKL